MKEPMINVHNIGKAYKLGESEPYLAMRDVIAKNMNPANWFKKQSTGDPFLALDDINFSVQEGEVLGLIGRNGAGKSTLLKILSRITPPTKGSITLNGRVASLLEVGTGFHPELTGRENIYLNGAILGMTKREIKSKFDEIVDFAEIEKFLDTPVKKYSSGMYVRLAFAVAAHLEPEILLVDEVLAVGDVAFQKKCLGKMSEVTKQSGRTIIFVSHNMGAIQNLCSRAILLSEGKMIQDGTAEETVRAYLAETAKFSAKIDLRERRDRQGNGKIQINEVRFYNADNQIGHSFRTGDSMRVEFDYESDSNEPLSKATFSMAISNQMGELVLNLLNTATGDTFDTIPKKGTFVLNVERLPLTPGKYFFNTFTTINEEIADWILDVGSFDVEFGDFFGSGQLPPASQGNFVFPHKWSVN